MTGTLRHGAGPMAAGPLSGVPLVMVLTGFRDRPRRSRAVTANMEAVPA